MKIKNSIWRLAAKTYRMIRGYPILYNVNNLNEGDLNRRALLVYLTRPFKLKPEDDRFYYHQNLKQNLQIASIIGEFGYIVDVADIRAKRINSKHEYDLVISHKYDLDITKINLRTNAIKIYLSTGINHIVNNKNLKKRYSEINRNRSCQLRPRRLTDENMTFVKDADYIVGFGNNFTMETWNRNFSQPKYCFNNYGFELNFKPQRLFNDAKKNFLYFASSGNVGKGLAHLLEVFPKLPQLQLYVCGSFQNEPDFCKCYQKELFETPNIHAVGWININSTKFKELSNKCAYVILPTCSDASTGSVVQCMHTGLIPVVTKEAGIDTEDFGVTFKNDSLEEIEKTILSLANMPEYWVKEKSEKTLRVANEKFSEAAFIKRWRDILGSILKE